MKESLSPNTTLSHYLILSHLGAGGMGEVWRAKDVRLNREVAIKVLPASFANELTGCAALRLRPQELFMIEISIEQ